MEEIERSRIQVQERGLQRHPNRWPLANVAKAYVIGRDAEAFALALPGVEAEICTTMQRAVAQAVQDAKPGEVVLLAPAAASFDQYDNFEQRGEDFAKQVQDSLG